MVHALAVGNRMQDLVTAAMLPGRTGDEVLAAARAAAAAEGVDGDVYSHPVGFYGHGAGPAIGMWDGRAMVINLPREAIARGHGDEAFGCAVLIQPEGLGPILAAREIDWDAGM